MKKLAKLDEYRPCLMESVTSTDSEKIMIIEIPVTGLSDPTITDVVSDCEKSKDGIYAFGQEWVYLQSNIRRDDYGTAIRIYVKEDEDAKTK